jgi:ubiquinone/menaquinone biosynthesis C-methylase UbiE
MAEFDAFAEDYEKALGEGLAASGENSTFFLLGRIAWLQQCVKQLGERPKNCLDYGCGIGAATPELLRFQFQDRRGGGCLKRRN